VRLWSVHPRHLDRQGLTACWRESLLAQAVLAGRTRGYRNHPQLTRFRAEQSPLLAIGAYLSGLADEAERRSYRFDRGRILRPTDAPGALAVTTGQLGYEYAHLVAKLRLRSPQWLAGHAADGLPQAHPLFRVVPGDVEPWEVRPVTPGGSLRPAP
jgi:hypothetical protein